MNIFDKPRYMCSQRLTLGIDASNLRMGGGVTHICELIASANPLAHGFDKIVVWGPRSTLTLIEDRPWLFKRYVSALDHCLIRRIYWQAFSLPALLRHEGCQLLFAPGGIHSAQFHPVVTMCRNMLPFQWFELSRYGFSFTALRLILLRIAQSCSFSTADGLIFLTNHAMRVVHGVTRPLPGQAQVIPHGLNHRFRCHPKVQHNIICYGPEHPYQILYVSIIDQYKHQWHLIEAVALLRKKNGWNLVLDLVGPAYSPSLVRLRCAMASFDPLREWVRYHGSVPHTKLHELYQQADLGVFASSCENMPNILLETMGAGLPVAASNVGPVIELLCDAGLFFDPEDPADIADVLFRLINDPGMRASLADKSYSLSQQYSWKACADQTFRFLADVYRQCEDGH